MISTASNTADVVIIGGGVMGASIAWHLVRQQAGRVTLLERETIAAGASGRTGALLRQHYSNRPEATLAHRSLAVFRHWTDVVGGDPVHTPIPLVVTIDTGPACEANLRHLHANVKLQNEVGIQSRVVSADELRALQPYAQFNDGEMAALEPDSGYVDAIAATRGLARAAASAGATIHESCPVRLIVVTNDRIAGVQTDHGLIATRTVVCAAGPWSASLLGSIGVDVPIESLRVQTVVLQRPLDLEPDHFVYLDTAAGMFCRPAGPGRTLVGVGGGDQHDPVDPDAFDQRIDSSYPGVAIEAIARRMPAMAGAAYLHGHVGLYDMTPDGHAIIGPAGPTGLFLAVGFSGAGFKKGPAVGEAVADTILTGTSPTVDLTPFRLSRFATENWREPWSDSEYVLRRDFGHRF